ncbi:MAG TPA: type II restriction endonuclease [Pseudoxanthomonas sp.]
MDLIEVTEKPLWNQLKELASSSSKLFVKKLSRNDTSWADQSSKHQAGFYIPREIRESGFFPPLHADRPEKPHIFRSPCVSFWPQTGEVKRSNMTHYSNKGPETHFTTIPQEVFRGLNAGSLLIVGKLNAPVADEAYYWFAVLDSGSDESELLETALDLAVDFRAGLFEPGALDNAARFEAEQLAELVGQIEHALRTGTLDRFIADVTTLPSSAELAAKARAEYLALTGEPDLNPFRLAAPGDAIMRISRDIEYTIFRRYELRRRAAEVVRILAGGKGTLADSVVRQFPALDAVFLSASQQRKTRAGRSFEFHIAAVLSDGNIRFSEQAITGGRRPDFVLPDLAMLKRKDRPDSDALVLAAKTTLRDRWKGLHSEALRCRIYLATVDDRVLTPVIDELERDGITLVVPESLKASKDCFYAGHSNAITFKELLSKKLTPNMHR